MTRHVVRLWGPVLLIVAVIMVPLALGGMVAGTIGVLVVAGVMFVALFVWITAMAVADMKARDQEPRDD